MRCQHLYIGTSGIVLPGAKKTFPPEFQTASRLHYYATLLNSLEINSSFYKVPLPKTFEKWALDVPKGFRFSVKLWRAITHARHLDYDPDQIDYFMKSLLMPADKAGCLLVQFPASITHDYFDKVRAILERIQKLDQQHMWRKAFEFRHPSWYNEQTYALLDHYQASVVLHDMPMSHTTRLNENADFAYLRFHGEEGDYKGGYTDGFLREHARRIQFWLKQGKHVYIYFNNTIGDAFANAQTLKHYIEIVDV